VVSHLESAANGEARLLAVPADSLMSSEAMGFGVSGKVFPADGLRSLSTFGDSLSGGMFFAGEDKGIS
jgi:hypothetical protein